MCKRISVITLIITCLTFAFQLAYALESITYDGSEHKYTAKDVSLLLNNDKFEPSEGQMPPIILENRTLVPVREVFEYLGGKVDWDGEDRRVEVTLDNKIITLWINKTVANVDGKEINLDVPAKIVNNKTMVPARFISEQGGLVVDWDAETYTVSIKFPKANITNIGFGNVSGVNCLVITADSKITGYKYFSIPAEDVNPYRLILDVENCTFKFDTTSAFFDEGMVSGIRFGNQGNDVNRIVLDLRSDTDYVVAMSKDRTKLYYAMAENFTIPGEEDNEPKQVEPKTTVEPEVVPNTSGDIKRSSGENIKPLEVTPSGDTNLVSGDTSGDIQASSGDINGDVISSGDTTKSGDSNDKIEIQDNSGDNIIIDPDNVNSLDDITPIESTASDEETENEEVEFDAKISSIKYSTQAKRVKVKYTGTIVYSDQVLTNPNRIVIDIENTKLETTGPSEINVKNTYITCIRFSQYTKSTVRIVLDLDTKCDYKIYKRSSEIQIDVMESTYRNIKYKKNTSNSQITLQNTKLSDIKYYQDVSKNKYVLTYSEKNCDFGNGVIEPDDDFVQKIDIDKGTITIVDTGSATYAIRQSSSNVVITVRKNKIQYTIPDEPEKEVVEKTDDTPKKETIITPKSDEKRVILIDVGHGGTDPGACNGDSQEKVYNLNIALYLYDMLKSRSDIVVYIDREDNNTYLNREDRVAYATKINPDFIVSIHNNSMENKSYSGTMVLYYNNDTESNYGDITSKECAEIVLNELVKSLDTINRGVVNRGDLHILSKTPCPSILCEVCFVSNDAELERLKTKTFQKDAAEAIYNGIVKILKEM